jgi:hypothetical protein
VELEGVVTVENVRNAYTLQYGIQSYSETCKE